MASVAVMKGIGEKDGNVVDDNNIVNIQIIQKRRNIILCNGQIGKLLKNNNLKR